VPRNKGDGIHKKRYAADRDFSIGDLAAEVIAVLDAAQVRSAHVVGFSMGGSLPRPWPSRRRPGFADALENETSPAERRVPPGSE
jgi:hypothetical protein